MEREVKIIRTRGGGAAASASSAGAGAGGAGTAERRSRRIQIITTKAIGAEAVCEPGCCAEGDECCGGVVCLCGCRAPEIAEIEEEGHTVITIRVPKVVREGGEDDALVRAAGVSEAVDSLASEMAAVVRRARAQGSSWTDIGAALGISKQAAWERFSGEE